MDYSGTFFHWLQEHFLQNAIAHRPILLLLDGHSSHFELSTIQLARQSEVILFCLPPHTTHVCQPLDCSFFGPLKKHWQQECHQFYRKHPGKVISKLNFCKVFRNAWLSAITPNNISAGFRKSDVYPFNDKAIQTTDDPDKIPIPDVQSPHLDTSSITDTTLDGSKEQNLIVVDASVDQDANTDGKNSQYIHSVVYINFILFR